MRAIVASTVQQPTLRFAGSSHSALIYLTDCTQPVAVHHPLGKRTHLSGRFIATQRN